MKFLIVVDMQVDFISGSLGSEQAKAIVPFVVEKVKEHNGVTLFTRDTHESDYLSTQEGRNLPVEHCIKNTVGWEICDELKPYVQCVIDKPVFGSMELPKVIASYGVDVEEIELCGLCTDICVISNAMLIKAYMPEVPVFVDASCCAGVTPKSHAQALEAMKMCQIQVLS